MNLNHSFFSKLNASRTPTLKAQRTHKQYVMLRNLVINPDVYQGRDSLVGRAQRQEEEIEHYTNPKSSFYLCKILQSSTPFDKLPTCLIRRVAYRGENKLDEWGKVVYSDNECKNLDQVSTEYHCYQLLKRSPRAVQLLGLLHENTRSADDRRVLYQVLKLPDRRSQGIRNIMFVLEEMSGGSLREQVERIAAKKQEPFGELQIVEYSCQLAQGLQELRQRGIIHRDLRPENILFHEGQLKISDFDSAFIRGYSDYRNIRNGVQMKDTTPLQIMHLIAQPEESLKKLSSEELWELQQHADVYFLGVNIYSMVFSQAFESFNGGKILSNLINIKKRTGFNPKLLELMARCLQKDSHKRIHLEEVVQRLAEIELQAFFKDPAYTRVYLSPDPLNLYSFSSNQIDQKLQLEAADFVVFRRVVDPAEMEADFQKAIRLATVQRNTKHHEAVLKDLLHERPQESLWYESPSRTNRLNQQLALRKLIESSLERLQIKAFYYQLAYRLLCEVGVERLAVGAEEYYLQNIQSHLQLLSSQLVVVLTFLYDMILKCSFTEDPHYSPLNITYENQRVFNSVRLLYSRRSFFAGRSQAATSSLNAQQLLQKLEQFKNAQGEQGEGEVDQVEEGVQFVLQGLRKVEALERMVHDFHQTQYENTEKRYCYRYEQSNLTRFLQKMEKILRGEMVQTIINLIISYEKLKDCSRDDPALKNAIFMLMILDAQDTNRLKKHDLVIIKEELTKLINLRIGWKAEELEAFFTNYTHTHRQQVQQGLHQLESQAVLAGSSLSIDPEDDHNEYQIKVEQPPEAPQMQVRASIEDKKEKESNLSFRIHPAAAEDAQDEDDIIPEIKVFNPRETNSKAKETEMEKSQPFEFQLGDSNGFNNRSSIQVEKIEALDH